ncbi:zinc-binding dehydrogenase [Streptantibioticus silvisoli]|uniref:2-deoxy-scyllo-inosamine dehydrogenase n=1 Tax=Streptantibioticus silvisoli TaxID=2705255 RepID=A0ABT6VTE5_9ACTN|nr:zinc-binding dehydrogenase [Streptantibioticus silvisoli]MDI5961339.1 zinc-binding dehydrogenase [Streptantibioticus silvisoli]
MSTSRAIVLKDFDTPPAEAEFPVGPPPVGGMTVACRYGGICGTDLHLAKGHLDVPVPLVLGHEGLGVVHELGEGTTHDVNGRALAPGDTVMWASSIACGRCHPCHELREPTLCENRRTYGVNRSLTGESPLAGSWADYISLTGGTTVIKLDEDIDPIAAMAFACAGPTMVHALFERRPVRLGETVVVQGSGPVGLAAACLAQLAGAHVILAGGPQARLDLAQHARIGHRHINVVEAADPLTAREAVLEATGGRGADLVIECAGVPNAVEEGTRLVRRSGSYLVVGQYTDSGNTSFNPHQIVYRQLNIIGSWAFTGAHLNQYVRMLPELCDRFDLRSLVTLFPLAEFGRALEQVASGEVVKAVLTT